MSNGTVTNVSAGVAPPGPRPFQILLITGVVAVSVLAWLLTEIFVVALAPILLVVIVALILRAPLHYVAAGFLFMMLAIDSPGEAPYSGAWDTPLLLVGGLIHENMKVYTHIPGLSFSLLDVLVVFLIVVVILRRGAKDTPYPGYVPVPYPLKLYAAIATAALIVWMGWGVARGGGVKEALFQIHTLVLVGPITYFFQRALRGPQDAPMIAKVIFASIVFKSALGLFFHLFIFPKPPGMEYLTTHSDSELFVVGLVIALLFFLQKRTFSSNLVFATMMPLTILMIVLNNRRLAWVCFIGGMVAIYALYPMNKLKKQLTKFLVVLAPILVVYVIVGAEIGTGPFKPAMKIMSLFSQKDLSNLYRDYENFNLVDTAQPHPLMGTGFGHPFNQAIKLDDISQAFSLWQYLPHNDVLWLLASGGLLGFTLIWMHMPITIYFAARGIRLSQIPIERTVGLVCVSVVITRFFLIFGDMGALRWVGWCLYAAAVAMVGKIATKSGAWPAPAPPRGAPTAKR